MECAWAILTQRERCGTASCAYVTSWKSPIDTLPTVESPALPRLASAGADGRTRLLFGNEDGQGEILLLNPDNSLSAEHALHPLTSNVVTTTDKMDAATNGASGAKARTQPSEKEGRRDR